MHEYAALQADLEAPDLLEKPNVEALNDGAGYPERTGTADAMLAVGASC